MVGAAIASGLDAIVLAEHDYMWDEAELADLQGRFPGIKIFAGIEVSIDAAEHIVVIGVPDRQLFAPFMAPADVIAAVRHHPGELFLPTLPLETEVRRDILEVRLDAVELYSNSIRNYMQQPIRSLLQKLQLPHVASSDGHHTRQLGLYAIDLPRPAQDDKELARMIRRGCFNIWANPERIKDINAIIPGEGKKLSIPE